MSLGLSCVQSCFELLKLLRSSTSDCIYFSFFLFFFCQSRNVDTFSLQILSPKRKPNVNSNHVDKDKFDINHGGVCNHAARVFFFLTTLTQAGTHGKITVPMCLGLLCVQSCFELLKLLKATLSLTTKFCQKRWCSLKMNFIKEITFLEFHLGLHLLLNFFDQKKKKSGCFLLADLITLKETKSEP